MWILLSFLLGVVTGVALVAAGVYYVLSFFFVQNQEKIEDIGKKKKEPTSSTFQLPHVLIDKINDESCKEKESCWGVNFVLYFLFRELRNSEGIRRWILKKLACEFDELLATSVLGKLFSAIVIQNIDLGQNFPWFNWLKTTKIELHPTFNSISTLDMLVDLDYTGGFQFSIKAQSHLAKHSAYLSVQFKRVKGQARLQFSCDPYAHWSISFVENPDVDISVVSQLYGKSFSQITSIIENQLKRSVRKKHSLPMYKVRYKPFFRRIEPIISSLLPTSVPRADVTGRLDVSIIECRGLMGSLLSGNVYATVCLAEDDLVAAYVERDGSISVVRDLACVKTAKRETNLDFTLGMINNIPTVESVSTSATALDFQVGDQILTVDGKKVTSVKHCIKFFKNSSSVKVVWRVKRKREGSSEVSTTEETGNVSPSTNANESIADTVPVSPLHPNPPSSLKSNVAPSNELNAGGKENPDISSTPAASATLLPRRGSRSPSPSHSSSCTGEVASDSDSAIGSQLTDNGLSQTERGVDGEPVYRNSIQNARQCFLKRTADLPCTSDPIFSESYTFNVEESHRYVNLAVWSTTKASSPSPSNSPNKRAKGSLASLDAITFNNSRLVGTISIPVSDVIAECCTTGMGYFVKDYYLCSPDGMATDAKENPLNAYSGFEPHMCYGKVSISFLFQTDEDASKRRDSSESTSTSNIPIEIGTDALAENISSPNEEYQSHQFVRINFRSATACDYCNKKIWLKDAFACRICHMKCHKRCNERCIANTICRGEGFYPPLPNLRSTALAPEIITSGEDEPPRNDESGDNVNQPSVSSSSMQTSVFTSNGSKRRTLGGLIASAVQNRSAQLTLRRTGSATNLLSPNQNSGCSSRSLPPSPKASPATSRKASSTLENLPQPEINPFEVLSAGGFGSSEEDINATVEHIIQNPNDDFVSMAKECGRDVYGDYSLNERKQKLNQVLNRLQEEIDIVSARRMELCEMTAVPDKVTVSNEIQKCEEKTQALALLMLYYCSGLQRVQDLEEMEKDDQLLVMSNNEAESSTS